ncbi:hypothetical protein LXL04_011038 [Taraxacum kok-saghyz]
MAMIGIVPEELNEENYEFWKVCVKSYLIGQDLWEVVSKEATANEQATPEWQRKNAQAIHAIQLACGSGAYSKYKKSTHVSAKFAWDHLAEMRPGTLLDHGVSTDIPDYMGSNMFDLNQPPESERHSTYSFGASSMINEEPTYQRSYFDHALMNEIPSEFQAYVSHIQNVDGDGHCGFRAVAVALGFSENYWSQIRTDLYEELLMHIDDYRVVFQDDINSISESLNYYGTPVIRKYWMIMSDTGILIANKYGVIVHFLSKDGSSTCFPLRSGPQDFANHPIINIALTNRCHYVNVDLQEGVKEYFRYENMYNAVEDGDIELVKEIFKNDPDAGRAMVTCHGDTALHLAILSGKLNIALELVKLMASDDLELANEFDVASMLLNRFPHLGVTPDHHGNYAIHNLAHKPAAFASGSEFSFWKHWIYQRVRIHSPWDVQTQKGDSSCEHEIDIDQSSEEELINRPTLLHRLGWILFLIANAFGVVVQFLTNQGSTTFFPLWRGPNEFKNHRVITFALVYNNHYVMVQLQGEYPMPPISDYEWKKNRTQNENRSNRCFQRAMISLFPLFIPSEHGWREVRHRSHEVYAFTDRKKVHPTVKKSHEIGNGEGQSAENENDKEQHRLLPQLHKTQAQLKMESNQLLPQLHKDFTTDIGSNEFPIDIANEEGLHLRQNKRQSNLANWNRVAIVELSSTDEDEPAEGELSGTTLSPTPMRKRFKDKLAMNIATEQGKTLKDAQGDLFRGLGSFINLIYD